MAPTSLDEGRGGAVVSVLVVVFHQGLKRRLVGGWMGLWWWYEQKGERAAKCGNLPNAEEAILGRGTNGQWGAYRHR